MMTQLAMIRAAKLRQDLVRYEKKNGCQVT
jgi:hypothetical protein